MTDQAAPSLARRLRGVWRMLRAGVHVLRGVLIVATRFRHIDADARMRHVQRWSDRFLKLLGVAVLVEGTPRPGAKLIVANHVSWLDILAIDAAAPACFVSKAEVRQWPVVGWLVSTAGTLYIERARARDALRVVHQMAEAMRAGDTLAVFPEGTTSDGTALLPFHANLLQGAIATETPVQPVALRYFDAAHAISPAVAWLDDTTLMQSLWAVVCAQRLGVRVTFLSARSVAHADRRALAETLRRDIEERLS